jgi:predicted KAP-like P-loop ATPase
MNPFDFSADSPATTRAEDYFQRYGFASRIAQVLLTRRESSSLTIGVYGSWGEGKTSVMHFIAQELAAHSDAIVINFNPWRFSD